MHVFHTVESFLFMGGANVSGLQARENVISWITDLWYYNTGQFNTLLNGRGDVHLWVGLTYKSLNIDPHEQ